MNENYLTDYGIFNGIIEGIPITIYTNQIKKENWNDYYSNLLNVLEITLKFQKYKVHLLNSYLMMGLM